MKALASIRVLAVIVPLALGACASTPTLTVRGVPTGGTVVDRMMLFQESLYAIAGRSASPSETALGVTAYCEDNRDALERMGADASALTEDQQTQTGQEIAARTMKLADRVKDAIGVEHMLFLLEPEVTSAMVACRASLPAPAEETPGTEPAPGE